MAIPNLAVSDLFLDAEIHKIYKGLGIYGLVSAEVDLASLVTKYNADCEGDVSFQIKRENWTQISDADWTTIKGYYINYMIYARMKAEAIAAEQFILYDRALKGLKERIEGSGGTNATPTGNIITRGMRIYENTLDRGIWQ